MATSEDFLARWENLTNPNTTAPERAGNYTVLTSYLKESGVDASFVRELCRHQLSLLKKIMVDITCKSCDHAALQLLGYCLHNVDFASLFSKEQVATTINGLCYVIKDKKTEKSVCTRALWCLTNQQLSVSHVTSHVTTIVDMATEVITIHHVGVATISSEALNLLMRFGQQFPQLFSKLISTWYKAIVEIMICKVQKVHQKALSLAVTYEPQLMENHDVKRWLTKALKERIVSAMLSQLTEKGLDHIHLIKSWSHFITVLGKTIHKHGSFLNELLRVVETGFKHRSPHVQTAAYEAWRTLVTNFSLDLTVMTAQKRLKLLLMPLLASAVRERHETVEQARIQTWWHLIGCLEHHRAAHFQNVCIPFLLLCLGLDPKSDVSQLANSISDLQSHSNSTVSHSNSTGSTPQTPKSTGSMHLAVTPTPSGSSAPSTLPTTPTSRFGPGRLLSAISTPRSRKGVEIEKGKKNSDRYQSPPNISMVMTGCHALLEFTGSRDKVPHSLIKSEPGQCVVFPKSIVSMETAQFMLLFLDALLKYHFQLDFKEKGIDLGSVVFHIVNVIVCSVAAEDDASSTHSVSAALLVPPLVDLLCSGSLKEHLTRQMATDVLSHLIGLSPRLLQSSPGGRGNSWRKLLAELLHCSKVEQTTDWFNKNWTRIVDVTTSSAVPLADMLYLSNELSRSVKDGSMEREVCSKLWMCLASKLTAFITQSSRVSTGTSLSPNFDTVRSVLKLPFFHLLDNGERSDVTSVMDVWKALYDTTSLHMGLVVKEANLCTELICTDLYSAYGQYTKQVPSSVDQRHQVLRFDLYQNAMASAISYVVSKIKWGALSHTAVATSTKDKSGKVKSMETLLSLLAWQLAAFWDTAKKGPLQLSQLTTPYTLLDVVESIYHHIPNSALVTMATEMVGQPLATLFEAILESCHTPFSSSRPRLSPQDLQHRVEKVWKSITMCFMSRHTHAYDSALLSTLSPLLVATLNSSDKQLTSLSLSFWAVTFDRSLSLDYPARLRDFFVKYLKDSKKSCELKLPGLHGNSVPASAHKDRASEGTSQANQSEVIQWSNAQTLSQVWNQDSDIATDSVLPPHSSPRKGVSGSFLNRQPPTSPFKPRPAPSSPLAKQLDEVLARSAAVAEKVQRSPVKVVGVPDQASSPLASARRRLDLNEGKEEYVSVAPSSKKRRLLTEHQEEVMKRRRSDLPTLYNALDPTLDSAPIVMDEPTQSEGDPPVVTSKSHDQPPSSSHSDVTTTVSTSIPILHSNTSAKTISPTSRDTPITIPDSPPHVPPPTLIQHSVSMTTTASMSTTTTPPVTVHSAPRPVGVVAPPTSLPQPHPSLLRISSPPQPHPSLPQPHPSVAMAIPTPLSPPPTALSFPVSMGVSSFAHGHAHFQQPHPRAVVITHPVSGSVLQIIPPVAMAMPEAPPPRIIQGMPPLPVHTSMMQAMVAQPVRQVLPQLVSQGVQAVRPHSVGIQAVRPPATAVSMTTPSVSGDVMVTSSTEHRHLPTYHEAVSHKALEEAFARAHGEPSAPSRRRMRRAKKTIPQAKEVVGDQEKDAAQKKLPDEASKGDAPDHQGDIPSDLGDAPSDRGDAPSDQVDDGGVVETVKPQISSEKADDILPSSSSEKREVDRSDEAVEGRPSTSVDKPVVSVQTSEAKATPTADATPELISSESEEHSTLKDSHDKSTVSSLMPDQPSVGGGEGGRSEDLQMESDNSKEMDVSAVMRDDVIMEPEESEDPLCGVKKSKKGSKDKEGEEMEQGLAKEEVGGAKSCDAMEVMSQSELLGSKVAEEGEEIAIERDSKIEKKEKSSDLPKTDNSDSHSAIPAGTESLESDTTQNFSSNVNEHPSADSGSKSDDTVKVPSSSGQSSSGGRKSLSLRRHSSSTATSGDGVEGEADVAAGDGGREGAEEGEESRKALLVDTPTNGKSGILKHTSQFDTPSAAKAGRRVQFATEPVFHEHQPKPQQQGGDEENGQKSATPKHARGPRTPQGLFSSRRTLMMSQTPPKMILVNKPLPPATPTGPVYPALKDCQSPIEQILPALSPSSKFTHGLLKLVSAQNITTVGNMSSLTEQEVQTLPIKSPKVQTLRGALRVFEHQLQSSKRKSSVDSEAGLAAPPPTKQPRLDFDLSSKAVSSAAADETTSSLIKTDTPYPVEETRNVIRSSDDLLPDDEDFSEASHEIDGPMITLCTPESQLTPPLEAAVVGGDGEEEGGASDDKNEEDEIVAEEGMELEGDQKAVVGAPLPETPPISPPHPPPAGPSAIGHDHTYCSQEAGPATASAKVGTDDVESRVTESSGHMTMTEPNQSTLSVMTHDHTYCSSQAREADSEVKGRNHGNLTGEGEHESSRSKLSLTVHDHTYCSQSWQREEKPCVTEVKSDLQEVGEGGGEGRGEGGEVAMEDGGQVSEAEVSKSGAGIEMETEPSTLVDSADLTETDSSLSQELFSQQTSQVHGHSNEAPPTAEPGNELLTSRADGGIAKGDGGEAGGLDHDNIMECAESAEKEENDQEHDIVQTDVIVKDGLTEVESSEVKVQPPPAYTISTGTSSDGSSTSSNPTHIAECSQRPPSVDPLPSSSSSSTLPVSDHTPSTEPNPLLDALTRFTEIGLQVNRLIEEKSSLSQGELLACQKAYGPVASFSKTLVNALTQQLSQSSNQDAASTS